MQGVPLGRSFQITGAPNSTGGRKHRPDQAPHQLRYLAHSTSERTSPHCWAERTSSPSLSHYSHPLKPEPRLPPKPLTPSFPIIPVPSTPSPACRLNPKPPPFPNIPESTLSPACRLTSRPLHPLGDLIFDGGGLRQDSNKKSASEHECMCGTAGVARKAV